MRLPKLCRNGDGRAFAIYPNSGGKRAYFGWHGTPTADAAYREWIADLAKDANEPLPQPRRSVTISQLVERYLAWSEANHSAGEHRNQVETLFRLLAPSCGEMVAAKFGPNQLRRFQDHLAASGRFSRTTVNSHAKRVRRFLRWCQSREMIPPGTVQELETVEPLRRGRTAARETEPVRPVAREVWQATLPFLREPIRSMAQIQFWCGMRPGEVCALRPCEIERDGPVWLYKPSSHKTAWKGRVLVKAVPAQAQAILEPFLNGPPERPAFVTIRKRPFTTLVYGAAIRRAVKRARDHGVTVSPWHPNQLRHASLTMVRDLLGDEAAQWWAGHADRKTTEAYTWTAAANLKRIADELGRLGA
jgi:integrase